MCLVEMTDEEKKKSILRELKNIVMLKADIPTKNGTVYSKESFEEMILGFTNFFHTASMIYSTINERKSDELPDMSKICGCVNNLRVETRILEEYTEECVLIGDITIINMPSGEAIDYLMKNINVYFTPFGIRKIDLSADRNNTRARVVSYELMGFKASLFAPQ